MLLGSAIISTVLLEDLALLGLLPQELFVGSSSAGQRST